MPDLLGICHVDGLSPSHSAGLSKLRGGVLGHRGGRVFDQVSVNSSIALVVRHDRDPASTICDERTGEAIAWIGREAHEPELGRSELAAAMRALRERDGQYFRNVSIPFSAAARSIDPQATWLVSDPHGLHPLYYGVQDGLFVFSSKLAPLLKSGLIRWSLDRSAVLDFFTYEHVTGDRTFADSVRVLPPGTLLCFRDGELCLQPYAELGLRPRRYSLDEVADALHEELDRSVACSLAGRRRIAVTLSGGLDSRALLGLAMHHTADLRTYTFGSADSADMVVARALAERAGVPNTATEIDGGYLLRWLDHGIFVTGGMVSCTQFHIMALADQLSAESDLVLDGLGGDALTGAHLKPMMLATRSVDRAVSCAYRQRATAFHSVEDRRALFEPSFLEGVEYEPRTAVQRHFAQGGDAPCWWGCHRFDLLERQRRFVQYGPHQLRPMVDVRTPFYATPVVELMTSVSAAQLLAQRAYLRMHARHLAPLASIPDAARGLPLSWPLGARLAKHAVDAARRRLPFPFLRPPTRQQLPTNYGLWFRTELRELVQDHLLGGNRATEGILRVEAIERWIGEHLREGTDQSAKLGCLLTFDAWLRSLGP